MIFFFISLSTYLCYLILKYQRQLKVVQDFKMDMKKYGNYVIKNPKETFLTPEILGIFIIVMALYSDAKIAGICMVVFYTLLFLAELRSFQKVKFNSDIIRIIMFIVILYVLLFLGFIFNLFGLNNSDLVYDNRWIYYASVIILSYLSTCIILLFGYLNKFVVKAFSKIKKH